MEFDRAELRDLTWLPVIALDVGISFGRTSTEWNWIAVTWPPIWLIPVL